MPKKASPTIADAMRRIAPADDPALVPPGVAPPAADTGRPASRRGCRVVTAHVDPAVHQQIRMLAVRQDTSGQALLLEALGDLFQKYGLPRIIGNPREDKIGRNHAA